MSADSPTRPLANVAPGTVSGTHSSKRGAFLAIFAGGLIVGTLDLTQAFILFGRRVPLVIAAGLLGRSAFHAGAGSTWSPPILKVSATYILGVLLHFFIATSVAAIYYVARRKLRFLIEQPLV